MEASRRLLDTAAKARNACIDACQQTMMGVPGFPADVAGAGPRDWQSLMSGPGLAGDSMLIDMWQRTVGDLLDVDELIAAGKWICLEWIDAYERAALAVIDQHERMAANMDLDWLQSLVATQAGFERELTKAYVSTVRALCE
jgi:hypothetical protein